MIKMREQQVTCELTIDRDCGNSVQTTSSGSYEDLESEDNGNERQPCTLTEENLSKVRVLNERRDDTI